MKTEVGRNRYQSIYVDKLSCRQVSFSGSQWTTSREGHERFQRPYQYGSIDTSFNPPLLSLDSTLNESELMELTRGGGCAFARMLPFFFTSASARSQRFQICQCARRYSAIAEVSARRYPPPPHPGGGRGDRGAQAQLNLRSSPGLWIRIHFLRIRIRIQSLMLETNTDPDTDPDPIQYGSRALMTKNLKKITAENFFKFFSYQKLQFTYP
jgi:hypothetical protein